MELKYIPNMLKNYALLFKKTFGLTLVYHHYLKLLLLAQVEDLDLNHSICISV